MHALHPIVVLEAGARIIFTAMEMLKKDPSPFLKDLSLSNNLLYIQNTK